MFGAVYREDVEMLESYILFGMQFGITSVNSPLTATYLDNTVYYQDCQLAASCVCSQCLCVCYIA